MARFLAAALSAGDNLGMAVKAVKLSFECCCVVTITLKRQSRSLGFGVTPVAVAVVFLRLGGHGNVTRAAAGVSACFFAAQVVGWPPLVVAGGSFQLSPITVGDSV